MDTSIYNTKAFTDAIKKMANSECKKIDEETYQIREQRLAALQQEAKQHYQSYIDYEVSRIKNETNRKIAKLHEDAKLQLTKQRNEIADKVFGKIINDTNEFCNSPAYKDFLVKSAKEVLDEFSQGDLEFFLNARDMKFSDDIIKELPLINKISQSDEIKLGGIKAIDYKTKCMADNTLDFKIEKQKEWFFKQSGLKI